MICDPCREAGYLNGAGYLISAAKVHEECKGGTWCCCQHKLGDYKNRRTDG